MELKPQPIQWIWKEFQALTVLELYELLQLRQQIFILEQTCLYPDIDGEDFFHHHLLAYSDKKLAGYLRVIPPKYHVKNLVAIGRVVVNSAFRGQGIARKMMLQGIDFCHKNYPNFNIHVSAQQYLEGFYQSLGFKTCSDMYLEDDIPHVAMEINTNSQSTHTTK